MDNPDTPKKRGRPPKKPMAEKHKDAIAVAVASGNSAQIVKAMAQANNTPALYNQKITDAHCEVIISRIAAGDALKTICEDLGISAALVRRRACDDRDGFGAALSMAKRISAEHSFDRELEIAFDMTIEASHKRIIIDVLQRRSKVLDREVFGDKVNLGVIVPVQINLTPDDRNLT